MFDWLPFLKFLAIAMLFVTTPDFTEETGWGSLKPCRNREERLGRNPQRTEEREIARVRRLFDP